MNATILLMEASVEDVTVGIPRELLDELERSRFAIVDEHRRAALALTIMLFLTREISIGRAAELAGHSLRGFQDLLRTLDLPIAFYGSEEYAQDMETIEALESERRHPHAAGS